MKRILAAGAIVAVALSASGCAVHHGPHDPYYQGHHRAIQGPTIYPTPYHRPWSHADRQSVHEQHQWHRWYSCQRYYGDRGRCVN